MTTTIPPAVTTTILAGVIPPPPTTPVTGGGSLPSVEDRPVGSAAVPGDQFIPDSNSGEFNSARDQALVDASVQHSFDPDPLVEYESTMLRIELAVVSNGDGDDPTPADIPWRISWTSLERTT